ncbi:hypothetical protein GIS00_23650 [Nakamurella sp. YIM 132087]|uniref:TfoX N-terminal domain-containing protein n=1 Tax=Nakamurella alba TaxID=2665158 RepID=A0A7K1FVU1_9ACTN|nr:TfoX/Sxy family protein [Nakamurella alba]MTD16934.1 hypothetical protein [Nakamurella alba]
MTPEQSELVDRLRAALSTAPVTKEVSMFGGRSFMVAGKLAVCALKNGGLLVRVDADRHDEFLALPGAVQAHMGADRTMGPGWIEVSAAALDGPGLDTWVGRALQYNRTVTD